MNRKTVFPSLALAAALAAALGLSSCAATGQSAGETGPASAAATVPTQQESSPTASAEPTATAAAPAPTSTAAATAAPTASAAAWCKTFTFPDGHLSFSYPSNWSIRMVGSPENAAKLRGVQAVIADATGNERSVRGSSAARTPAAHPARWPAQSWMPLRCRG